MDEYKKKTNTGDDVFIRLHDSQTPSRPTAVLFGWLGAKHRTLGKYSAIYAALGYNTVQLVAPLSTVFSLQPRSPALFLLSVMRILSADYRLTAGGTVLHLFSNGGAICAPHLSEMFLRRYPDIIKADDELVVSKFKDSFAAIIFDSSPCYLHVHLGARAINEGLSIPQGPLSFLVYTAFFILCLFQRLFVVDLPKWYWDALTAADYGCPEQYIYSEADQLLDAPRLDSLIDRRKKDGHRIHTFRVDDAAHVSILRKYPDKYVEIIRSMNDGAVNAWRERHGLQPWLLDTSQPSR